MHSLAESVLKAKVVLGVGTLFFFRTKDVISLFPHISLALNEFTTGNPVCSRQ
jgi:hypothetical protein